jgi:hypothetical protein
MNVQLNSLHRNTGISKDCDSDTSSLQTLEFGGDCWIFYGLGPFIPLNLRSQEMDKGVPHARAAAGRAGRGVARQGRQAGERAWCGCVNF